MLECELRFAPQKRTDCLYHIFKKISANLKKHFLFRQNNIFTDLGKQYNFIYITSDPGTLKFLINKQTYDRVIREINAKGFDNKQSTDKPSATEILKRTNLYDFLENIK